MSSVAVFNVTNDPAAQELEQIFREHSGMVYRTAYSVTGSHQDAEDIVQNLFLHLLRPEFPPGLRENPKAYLYRSAVNQSLNVIKSRKRAIVTAAAECPDLPAGTDEPELETDMPERLVAAMAKLNPAAVEMLILRYEHNYSDAEIGKMLGKSRGMVAVTMYRARARLKRLLNSSLGEKL